MLSAGAAVFPHDGECYEALLAAADSRMYRDKSERRTHDRAAACGCESLDSQPRAV
jgi:GGDEF domain-containing protein